MQMPQEHVPDDFQFRFRVVGWRTPSGENDVGDEFCLRLFWLFRIRLGGVDSAAGRRQEQRREKTFSEYGQSLLILQR